MKTPQPEPENEPIVITCISDTHSWHKMLDAQPSDLLIHCGDCTSSSCTPEKFARFIRWMAGLPFDQKVLVGGNHDVFLEANHDLVRQACAENNIHYLRDELVVLTFPKKQSQKLKIYGSPWLSWRGKAFITNNRQFLREKAQLIPEDADIVVTHCPPYGHRDKMNRLYPCGNAFVAERISQCHTALSVAGHIHEMYGVDQDEHTTYVNCALLNEHKLLRRPIVVSLQDGRVASVNIQGHL